MHPDVNFIEEWSDWIHNIEVLSLENGATYGICYPESRTTYTYLAKHESEVDIQNTMQHEPIHSILSDFQFCPDVDEEPLLMDLEQEHKIIQKVSWVVNGKVFDTGYFSMYDGREIQPSISEKEYLELMKKYNKMSDKVSECN